VGANDPSTGVDVLLVVARVFLALVFLHGGLRQIRFPELVAEVARNARPGKGPPEAVVRLAGVVATVAAAGIVLGVWIDLAAIALIAYLLPVTVQVHAFWRHTEPRKRRMVRTEFLMNVCVVGGLLMLLVWTNQAQHAPLALTDTPALGRW